MFWKITGASYLILTMCRWSKWDPVAIGSTLVSWLVFSLPGQRKDLTALWCLAQYSWVLSLSCFCMVSIGPCSRRQFLLSDTSNLDSQGRQENCGTVILVLYIERGHPQDKYKGSKWQRTHKAGDPHSHLQTNTRFLTAMCGNSMPCYRK